jgi:hypothetical protein
MPGGTVERDGFAPIIRRSAGTTIPVDTITVERTIWAQLAEDLSGSPFIPLMQLVACDCIMAQSRVATRGLSGTQTRCGALDHVRGPNCGAGRHS